MNNDEDVLNSMSPPPSLSPMDGLDVEDPMMSSEDHPMLKAQLEEEKNSVYSIMYSHSQHSDLSFTRPVTPLQITIPDGNASPTVPVSCGIASGKMHLHMFLCPGIHQPCIEIGSELLSPKQFTVRGDKEKQKDWKASIRVGRSSLRTHMEAATIDFYDHANRCSGKCQSRNYVNAPIEREEVIQSRKAKRNADADYLKNEIEHEIHGKEVDEKKNWQADESLASSSATSSKKSRGRPRGSVNKPRPAIKVEEQDESFFEEFFTDEPLPAEAAVSEASYHAPAAERVPPGCSAFADIMNCLQNDPQNFWSQMQQTGVIAHFCDDLIVSAINLKQSVMDHAVNHHLSNMLTRTTFALGVQNVVVQRVQSIERSVMQQRKHDEMFQEIQLKVAEEQRKRLEEITVIDSSTDVRTSYEELQTARELDDEFIDVVKFDDYPYHQQPGPSTAP